jgi:DNA-binding protein HU-beta
MSNGMRLVDKLADRADLTKADAEKVIEVLFDAKNGIIAEALRRGDRVSIAGFGTFEPKHRGARKGRNPRTGREIDIAASTSAAFRSGKSLKDSFGS